MNKKDHIVYLGCSGFPYGLAEIQKMMLISKSLVHNGHAVTVVCKRGMHKKTAYPDLKPFGNYEGVDYVYTSHTVFREEKFITRNFLKVKGFINEFLYLRKLGKQKKLDYAFISTHTFATVAYYSILSKLFGFKTALSFVEYYSGMKKQWFEFGKKLNNELFDKFAPKIVDAVFPISEFIIADLKKNVPGKKYFKIPVLTDFDRYNDVEVQEGQKYFLFCGAANYFEVVKFIIDSFELLNNPDSYLFLVINGYEKHIEEIKNYIAINRKKEKIKLISNLTNKQLNSHYKNAMALLIPLRPNIQDTARFPHKIGEYLASGNPVISTNYGEVKYYFKDMENMLIADEYDVKLFAQKMQFVLDNKSAVQRIGNNGMAMALSNFEYRSYGEKISSFLHELK